MDFCGGFLDNCFCCIDALLPISAELTYVYDVKCSEMLLNDLQIDELVVCHHNSLLSLKGFLPLNITFIERGYLLHLACSLFFVVLDLLVTERGFREFFLYFIKRCCILG
jgi:hypothetical protein